MTTILPAIIPESFNHLHDEVAKVKDFVSCVQVDIGDGQFIKNKTWPYRGDMGEFEGLLREDMGLPFWEDIDYEFHLMIEQPEKTIQNWITVGASSIVVQIEATTQMEAIIEMCHSAEVSLCIAIKPSTDTATIAPYVDRIECIQCMGSDNLGHHNEQLNESVYEKIRFFRETYPEMQIAVDIGVNHNTAQMLVASGATKLISGGAIFQAVNIAESIDFFQKV